MWDGGVRAEIADPTVILLESYWKVPWLAAACSNNSRGHILDKEEQLMPYGEIWAGFGSDQKERVREVHSEGAKPLKCWWALMKRCQGIFRSQM